MVPRVVTASWRPLVLGLALALAGCAGPPRLAPPAGLVPDLRGTWEGTWGGTPLELLVLEQEHEQSSPEGVSLGPWTLLGPRLPGVSGVLTYTARGEVTAVNVRGQLGDSNGRLTLVLHLQTPHGQQIVLTHVDGRRLSGAGTSPLSWDPVGPVDLTRRPPGGESGARR